LVLPGDEIFIKVILSLLIAFVEHFNEVFPSSSVILELVPVSFEAPNSVWLQLFYLLLNTLELITLAHLQNLPLPLLLRHTLIWVDWFDRIFFIIGVTIVCNLVLVLELGLNQNFL